MPLRIKRVSLSLVKNMIPAALPNGPSCSIGISINGLAATGSALASATGTQFGTFLPSFSFMPICSYPFQQGSASLLSVTKVDASLVPPSSSSVIDASLVPPSSTSSDCLPKRISTSSGASGISGASVGSSASCL